MRTRLVLSGYGLVLGLLVASNAAAQEPAGDAGAAPAEPSATSDLDDGEELDQKTDAEDELSGPDANDEPVVNPEDQKAENTTQYTIGARYRFIVVPNFLINAFGVDGGRDILVHGVGAEFGIAKSNFEIIFSPWYAGYGMQETPFKGPGDPQNAWELVTSNLSALYLTADLLWRKNIVQDLDFTVGVSGGIGIVFGTLPRWEAINPNFPGAPNLSDAGEGRLTRCPAGGDPNRTDGQCVAQGGNYGTGEMWPVYPWLSGQVGLRWNPHENFVGRFDLGASSTGFWLGVGADYGL